jgi:hypothetical protein
MIEPVKATIAGWGFMSILAIILDKKMPYPGGSGDLYRLLAFIPVFVLVCFAVGTFLLEFLSHFQVIVK